MKRKIAVLGATGSIGKNTLDVIASYPDAFEVVLLSANRDLQNLLAISRTYPDAKLALADESNTSKADADKVSYWGPEGIQQAVRESGAQIVVNGIAGAPGLLPSITALETGADLALANKETIVMAGPLAFALAKTHHCRILPVDSEHSAVFQLLEAHGRDSLEEIILTASGGPFRQYTKEQLEQVTLNDALAHPTWKMGGKITIDSASLANKGLEVIEAVRLFEVPPKQVKVLVHPQSYIHSLIRLKEGSLYAQMSRPDMRVPIHNALFWPEVRYCQFGRLDLEGQSLSFEKPREDLFPMLPLAYKSAEAGSGYPAAYNAADEEAVAAFMKGQISFTDIGRVVEQVLQDQWECEELVLDSILEIDKRARSVSKNIIKELFRC
ncbi:MAG TPA: 1-deoxy-D-xylulose-5-phosphate reductoisomerase [Treponema sp.]|jgi:1-deoxy-D-xylulose-5-phosphate reductoisomerase|uniref:1-deoxy-D-xylulose-5-phosphate reductoisomerase n=1 Tax=Gracilinema caldarium TaxID=215591 RepID=UPI0016919AF7|nr:1-deoxy-D-xylulose-5-phosphate reductoisomerase [Gracilinema caldarium]NLJ10568.1 1-deoxy-D-xylulose-5-phosphate reductoisomerase [Treponema sp.]HPC70360.1 1-deoxy-D-xylulose-5-phosphate reductoisomerase [Treponema sp.]HRS03048.1 1-deoxy-D-xylulose-5-phosphate reductoisomerase [Treponema sp.]HRU27636.1 1-deoxy-D-xylulose-5-phosphate reductoisomerase [Treponema sp.]